jgi:Na+/proline symporter
LVTVAWNRLAHHLAADYALVYELVPAFGLAFLAAVIVSLLTWEKERERVSPSQ